MTESLKTLGFQVAAWVEYMLVHGPGDVQGEPIYLEQDAYAALMSMYELDPVSGRRVVRRYHYWRPKGRAKSELAGMIVCAELLGPVRFSHWAERGEVSDWGYEFEEGEPVGKPVTSPFIRCLATEAQQSGNTYDNVEYMLGNGRIPEFYPDVEPGRTRTLVAGQRGEVRPSTAKSASKDGGKETFAVFDETHLYRLPDQHQMYATVRRNLRKRKAAQPWFLDTSTMYLPGEGSVAEASHLYAQQIAEGKASDDGFRFDYRHGPQLKDFEFDDDRELEAALREAYAPAEWLDFKGMVSEARDPDTDQADFIRYFLNVPAGSAEDVYHVQDWDALAVPGASLEPGEQIVVMFDGSDSGDSTGIVGMNRDGHVQVLGCWEKPDGLLGKDWTVPRLDVNARVAEIFDTYRVVLMYCDPPYWQTDIDRWQEEHGQKVVLDWPTMSDQRMAQAAERFVTMCRAGEVSHDGDPLFRKHLGNARRSSPNRYGWRPVKRRYDAKIDLVVCLIGAAQAHGDAIANEGFSDDTSEVRVELW